MSIWFGEPSLEWANERSEHALIRALGIEMTELTEDSLKGRMPVDHRTRQPAGVLHGGASVALAETLGSLAGTMCLDASKEMAVGIEINANHVRAATAGIVTGTARPLHIGRNTQVWEIRIENEDGKLVCISRLTLAVVPRQSPKPV